MAVAASYEQRKLAAQWRDEGATWSEITAALRAAYPGLGGFAAARQAHSWSQRVAADGWCARWPHRPIEWKAISSWECWPGPSGRRPSLLTIDHLAQLYEVSASDLLAGWADYRTEGGVLLVPEGSQYAPGVDRRSFLGLLAAAGASAVSMPQGTRVGSADVEHLRGQLWQLWHADEAQGGGAVYRGVLDQLDQVRGVLDRGSYGSTVGRDLQVIAGQLTELAGFTAYDAGNHDLARQHFNEALAVARVADDPALETYVLAQLANMASWLGQGRETVELATAAQRITRGPARLTAVLSAREAEGHALRGDAVAAQAALGRSERELADAGDDGGVWFAYFDHPTLQTMAAKTYLSLDAPTAAERAARESVTPDLARRPRALHSARHAQALVATRELDRARHKLGDAENLAQGISSARLQADLADVHRALAAA